MVDKHPPLTCNHLPGGRCAACVMRENIDEITGGPLPPTVPNEAIVALMREAWEMGYWEGRKVFEYEFDGPPEPVSPPQNLNKKE